jgi:voltage-gated potassium channel
MKEDSTYRAYINTLNQQAITVLAMVVGLIATGIVGYTYLEKWSMLDALYMTIVTLATVGFKEVHPLSKAGEVFTICLISLGVGVFTYGAATFSRLLIEGELKEVFYRRRLAKVVRKLNNHVIICGFGRLGERISHELHEKGTPFVVIDNDPEQIVKLQELGYPYVEADTSDESALEEAGIDRARALIAVVSSDADNLFLTISAREMNPNLHIVARVDDPSATNKLYKAGANRVVSPYDVGARMLASVALKPTLSELMEISSKTTGGTLSLVIEEVVVKKGSVLDGVIIRESRIREETGATVVAVKKVGSSQISRAEPELSIEAGDLLVVIGSPQDIKRLEAIAGSADSR